MPSTLPTPAEAAATLRRDGAMLEQTREQARSAALLATMMANPEQNRLLLRALSALDELETLPTQVYLIGRLYKHVADVYTGKRVQLQLAGPTAAEIFEQRSRYMYLVCEQLRAGVTQATDVR